MSGVPGLPGSPSSHSIVCLSYVIPEVEVFFAKFNNRQSGACSIPFMASKLPSETNSDPNPLSGPHESYH